MKESIISYIIKFDVEYFIIPIFFSTVISIILTTKTPYFHNSLFDSNRNKFLSFKLDNNDPFIILINDSVKKSYGNYIKRCIGYDVIRPITNECINIFGFNSSLIESLETLYLLGLTDLYELSVSYIKKNIRCSDIRWINRHDFFSRFIASFIGIYLLTSDNYFLSLATACTDIILDIEKRKHVPSTFINLKSKEKRQKLWLNGTSLNDASSGLPEVMSLFNINKNIKYKKYVLSRLRTIPLATNQIPPTILSYPRGFNGTEMRLINDFSAQYYHNLFILNEIFYNKRLNTFLKFIIPYFSHAKSHYASVKYFDSITRGMLESRNHQMNLKQRVMERISYLFNAENVTDSRFKFDGTILSVLSKIDVNSKYFIRNTSMNILRSHMVNDCYSGRNLDRSFDNIQPSEFFGHFIKVLIISEMRDKRKFCLNEHGHILHIE